MNVSRVQVLKIQKDVLVSNWISTDVLRLEVMGDILHGSVAEWLRLQVNSAV